MNGSSRLLVGLALILLCSSGEAIRVANTIQQQKRLHRALGSVQAKTAAGHSVTTPGSGAKWSTSEVQQVDGQVKNVLFNLEFVQNEIKEGSSRDIKKSVKGLSQALEICRETVSNMAQFDGMDKACEADVQDEDEEEEECLDMDYFERLTADVDRLRNNAFVTFVMGVGSFTQSTVFKTLAGQDALGALEKVHSVFEEGACKGAVDLKHMELTGEGEGDLAEGLNRVQHCLSSVPDLYPKDGSLAGLEGRSKEEAMEAGKDKFGQPFNDAIKAMEVGEELALLETEGRQLQHAQAFLEHMQTEAEASGTEMSAEARSDIADIAFFFFGAMVSAITMAVLLIPFIMLGVFAMFTFALLYMVTLPIAFANNAVAGVGKAAYNRAGSGLGALLNLVPKDGIKVGEIRGRRSDLRRLSRAFNGRR